MISVSGYSSCGARLTIFLIRPVLPRRPQLSLRSSPSAPVLFRAFSPAPRVLAMAKRKRGAAVQAELPQETSVPLPPGVDLPTGTTATENASVVVQSKVEANVGRTTRHGVKTSSSQPANGHTSQIGHDPSDSPLSDLSGVELPKPNVPTRGANKRTAKSRKIAEGSLVATPKPKVSVKPENENLDDAEPRDPEMDKDEGEAPDEEEVKLALSRPPPVHSDYLPLPWKGRLGFACLNTYLRTANPPVFSSRTCRIASIVERRYPLKDPTAAYHPTKNRPDRSQTPDVARGMAYVQDLGLTNARDIVKMIRWNDKFGIKFMRLSSEMFPFASHDEHGYKLAPFASEALAEAGRVAGELGHRLTTHPGQFTQLGSPRKEVIQASIRDLEYHAELLSLLKLPPQQDRDAVMIIHMGGVFGDKEATLDRFRENYKRLPQGVKKRLVLENDDVSWSVHELLPICQELDIPLVLDYHHHNIVHSDQVREGTLDIMNLYDDIKETWTRKGITQKMHCSEPEPGAITPRQRRKHSPRVMVLPPCDPTMDLMIEAKDKEQAVFELMRTYKLPGWDRIHDMVPHIRVDENIPMKKTAKKPASKKKAKKEPLEDGQAPSAAADAAETLEEDPPRWVPNEEIGMGGPEGRVYWPPGMESWLHPPKRIVKKKDPAEEDTKASVKKRRTLTAKEPAEAVLTKTVQSKKVTALKGGGSKKKAARSITVKEELHEESDGLPDLSESEPPVPTGRPSAPQRQSARARRINYADQE